MPTLEQIQAKLKKLQSQADVLIAKKAQAAVDQIRELMIKHGLTTADIEAQAKARRNARALLNGVAKRGPGRPAGSTKAAKAASAAKYRDPKTGATWTGHGRAPGWIAAVKDRTAYLVAGASEVKAAVAPARRGKGQPKGAQPAKYLNPKTGATWSGRGPAPAWLATVKDRSKFLIDGAAAAVSAKPAAKAGKAKATAGRKSAAKKAGATRKTAAKKAVPASRKAAVKKTVGRKGAVKTARKASGRKAAAKSVASAPAASQSPAVQGNAA